MLALRPADRVGVIYGARLFMSHLRDVGVIAAPAPKALVIPICNRPGLPLPPPFGGFDPAKPTCYKRLFCAGRAGSGFYFSCPLFQIDPGAKSDAAKLNTPSGLAVEACSEFRKP
jgi:hypothetical protein